jgi:hypothetical protein
MIGVTVLAILCGAKIFYLECCLDRALGYGVFSALVIAGNDK